ncbi:hypothetical protein LTR17_013033 [Elasticomyces elasticus]|nr:hypothetical protein LTR17_013033 [Elasticomyces elasticus]
MADFFDAHAFGMTDEELARHIHEQELIEDALANQAAARRLERAEQQAVPRWRDDREQIEQDHEYAMRLQTEGDEGNFEFGAGRRGQEHEHGHEHEHDHNGGDPDDEEMLFVSDAEEDDDPMVEGLPAAAPVAQPRGGEGNDAHCAACYERDEDLFPAPACHHSYCGDCLTNVFRHSMNDEALFPPRCCAQSIPFPEARIMMEPELAREFEVRAVELGTQDRTYCHEAACATFIPPVTIRADAAVCPTCDRVTCAMCKQENHPGADCPEDEGLQLLLETAQGAGWRRCEQCRRVIERNTGCNHMTSGEPALAINGTHSHSQTAPQYLLIGRYCQDRPHDVFLYKSVASHCIKHQLLVASTTVSVSTVAIEAISRTSLYQSLFHASSSRGLLSMSRKTAMHVSSAWSLSSKPMWTARIRSTGDVRRTIREGSLSASCVA